MKGKWTSGTAHHYKDIFNPTLHNFSGSVFLHWMERHTFLPTWLEKFSCNRLVGYGLSLVCICVVLLSTSIVGHLFSLMQYAPLSIFLAAFVLIGLAFGAGPALLAVLVGGFGLFAVPLSTSHLPVFSTWVIVLPVLFEGLVVDGLLLRSERSDLLQRREKESLSPESIPLETIFESLADGVIVSDMQGVPLRYNTAISRIFGLDQHSNFFHLSLEERRAALEVRDENGRPFAPEQFPHNRVLRGETIANQDAVDVKVRHQDGEIRQLNFSGAPVRNQAGAIIGSVTILRDVTKSRQKEAWTRQSLQILLKMAELLVHRLHSKQLEALPRSTPSSSEPSAAGEVHTVTRLAELACEVLQCSQASVISFQPGTEIMQPVELIGFSKEQEKLFRERTPGLQYREIFQEQHLPLYEQVRQGKAVFLELQPEEYEGTINRYQVRTALVSPMMLSNTLVGVLTFHYDHTPQMSLSEVKSLAEAVARLVMLSLEYDRLITEREEAQARERIQQTSRRYMEEFLSMASHELRTPLTMINTNVQWLQRKLRHPSIDTSLPPRLKDTIHEGLDEAHHQIKVFQHLVDDLLDVSRIQAGKLRLQREMHDVVLLVRLLVEGHRHLVFPREILLELPMQQESMLVFMDATRIEQVLSNYLTNAFKYAPGESAVKVTLQVETPQKRVRVLVQDQGPGILHEEQMRIWDRFQQIEGCQIEGCDKEGLGLGLYISRSIIEQHQGEVGVESSPGEGATFWFTLPYDEEG